MHSSVQNILHGCERSRKKMPHQLIYVLPKGWKTPQQIVHLYKGSQVQFDFVKKPSAKSGTVHLHFIIKASHLTKINIRKFAS